MNKDTREVIYCAFSSFITAIDEVSKITDDAQEVEAIQQLHDELVLLCIALGDYANNPQLFNPLSHRIDEKDSFSRLSAALNTACRVTVLDRLYNVFNMMRRVTRQWSYEGQFEDRFNTSDSLSPLQAHHRLCDLSRMFPVAALQL